MKEEVPIYHKALLTLTEAAEYFNIGINKLREITDNCRCPYVLFVGSQRLIKRVKLEQHLDSVYEL